ncbi:MAG TPA: hypothetical protein PLH86_11685 [Saprospiraceae bacterium]|nr:hypothetical protein [Saprospiraceae bacterium]
MIKRVLNNWTFTRALYLILGVFVIVQSVMLHQWVGALLGAYFASMGLFAFGCAAGNCFGTNQKTEIQRIENMDVHEIEFEEVKRK